MDYEEVPVGDRIFLQPKLDSGHSTLPPTAIQSLSVRDCPMGFCVKIEFGSVTSVCKHLDRYGGGLTLESVECDYDQSPTDRQVMLLGVYTCPLDRLGCIWLEEADEKQCNYLGGILEPVSGVRSHYFVVCNHPANSSAD